MNIVTFGSFNIIHAGHVEHFRYSKQICTSESKLIVGLCADAVVNLWKSFCVPFRDRLDVLMAIEHVDVVDIYGDGLDLSNIESRADIVECIKPIEAEFAKAHNADIVTFGDDKPIGFYDHLEGVRQVRFPRRGLSSSEIYKGISV